MDIGGDRFRREFTQATVPLAFFRKGIKGDALVRNDFRPVGLVEGNFLWWAFAQGTPWTPVHPAGALGARPLFCLTPGPERTIKPRALLMSGLWLPDHGLGGSIMLMPGSLPGSPFWRSGPGICILVSTPGFL